MDSSDARFLAEFPSFYPTKCPSVGDCVVAKVTQVNSSGAYVTLLEYALIEAVIPINELSRRGSQDIKRLVWRGRQIVTVVLKADGDSLDLSKKRVPAEAVNTAEQRYAQHKQVYSLVKSMAVRLSVPVKEVYEAAVYPLYQYYTHPLEGFKALLTEDAFSPLLTLLPAAWTETAESVVQYRLGTKRSVESVEVVASTVDGLDNLRSILLSGTITPDSDRALRVTVKAPPFYTVTSSAPSKTEAISQLNIALGKMKARADALNATFVVKATSCRE
jgi:translation initiation factor 2 alpha subunit (eIF-2alpha)